MAVPNMSSKKAGVQATEEAEWEPRIQLWKPVEEPLVRTGMTQVVNKAWEKRKDHRRNSKTRARKLFGKTAPWGRGGGGGLTNETVFPFKASWQVRCGIQLEAALH